MHALGRWNSVTESKAMLDISAVSNADLIDAETRIFVGNGVFSQRRTDWLMKKAKRLLVINETT